MAFEYKGIDLGVWTAAADYSSASHPYRCVTLTTAGTVKLTTAATAVVIGVLQNRPSSGQMALVRVSGVTKLRMSTGAAVVARNTKLGAFNGAGGYGGPQAAGVTLYILGRALDVATSATGTIVSCLITHQGGGSSGAVSGA